MTRFLVLLSLAVTGAFWHLFTLSRFFPDYLSGAIPAWAYYQGIVQTAEELALALLVFLLAQVVRRAFLVLEKL